MLINIKDYLTAMLMFKCVNGIAPDYLCNEFYKITDVHDRVTRQSSDNDLYLSTVKTSYMQRSLRYYGANLWNRIPMNIRETDSTITIKKLYNNFITLIKLQVFVFDLIF